MFKELQAKKLAKRFSEMQLWGLVNRADTHEKIEIAIDFITKQEYLSVDVFDEMMDALAFQSRELYRAGI